MLFQNLYENILVKTKEENPLINSVGALAPGARHLGI